MRTYGEERNPGYRLVLLIVVYLLTALLIALCFPESRENIFVRPVVVIWNALLGSRMPHLHMWLMLFQLLALIGSIVGSYWLGYFVAARVNKDKENRAQTLNTWGAVASILGFILAVVVLISQQVHAIE